MRKKRCEKQLTLHFTGDNARIVDAVKEMAAYDFRTPEQEVIYLLATHGRMIPRLSVKEGSKDRPDLGLTFENNDEQVTGHDLKVFDDDEGKEMI